MVTRLGSTRFTGLVMTIACTFGVVQSAIAFAAHPARLPVEALLLGAAIAAFATVVPTWLLNEAIGRLGSGRASLLSLIGPIVTIFLEAVVLGDRITATDLAGTACALAGVTLLTSKRGAQPRPAADTPPGSDSPAPPPPSAGSLSRNG
jgi:drug/metabolite transporter (DMT)-like permease